MTDTQVVQVALPVPMRQLFDYSCTDNQSLPVPGMRVMVPLQKRTVVGIVCGMSAQSAVPIRRLRHIIRVLDLDEADLLPFRVGRDTQPTLTTGVSSTPVPPSQLTPQPRAQPFAPPAASGASRPVPPPSYRRSRAATRSPVRPGLGRRPAPRERIVGLRVGGGSATPSTAPGCALS